MFTIMYKDCYMHGKLDDSEFWIQTPDLPDRFVVHGPFKSMHACKIAITRSIKARRS